MKRRNAKSPEIIKQQFEEFKKAKTFHRVVDRDIYNFDKKKFKVDYRK